MSRTYRISEVAERTGFSRPTIRYYEQIGLIPAPERLESGYRVYDDRGVERLAFVSRAKRLGLSLEEVRELSEIWDDNECGPVQQRLAAFVAANVARTQSQISDLTAFGMQLEAAAARMAGDPKPGPCNEDCACSPGETATAILDAPIVCTLEADAQDGRLGDWQTIFSQVTHRTVIAGGISLAFRAEPAFAAQLSRLAVAEQDCCAFFDFTIRVAGGALYLDIRGPESAQGVISAMFGAPATS